MSAPEGTTVQTGGNNWENETQLFVTEGTYAYFEAVWLDGVKLQDAVDYTSVEGSTRITIRTQTLTSVGNGTHTIAAEFRDGSDNLHRASQNYELTTLGTGGGSSSGGGTGGGSTGGGSTSGGGNSSDDSEPVTSGVSMEQPVGGSLSSNHASAVHGDTVTVTATPDAGYQMQELIVTDRRGNRIAVSDAGDNQYTFTMPDVSVTIEAVFTEIPEPEPDPATGLPFVDVRMSDWYTSYVTDVYTRGLMTGIDGQHFAPGMTTSRGMIVTILHRMAGSPSTEGSYFSDVPLNQYYAQAAAWAAENAIVSGYGDGRFGPDDPVTREQLVLILMRYAISKAISTDSRMDLSLFSDSGLISEEAVQAMSWACAEGLLNGKGNYILDPEGQATRAEVATIFSRFCQILGCEGQ